MDMVLATLRIGAPLILIAMAGLLSERSGIFQIGLESLLIVTALFAASFTYILDSSGLGIGLSMVIGVTWMLIFGFFTISLKLNAIIVGAAFNLLAVGLAPLVTKALFDSSGQTPSVALELRPLTLFYWLPLAVVGSLYILFYHSRLGLFIHFAGSKPGALAAVGVGVAKVQYLSLALAGGVGALAGSSLSLALSSGYSPFMSAGRGFIALAAVILGRWRVLPTLLACLGFSFIDSWQIRLQGQIDPAWVIALQLLPYLITVLVLILFSERTAPFLRGLLAFFNQKSQNRA